MCEHFNDHERSEFIMNHHFNQRFVEIGINDWKMCTGRKKWRLNITEYIRLMSKFPHFDSPPWPKRFSGYILRRRQGRRQQMNPTQVRIVLSLVVVLQQVTMTLQEFSLHLAQRSLFPHFYDTVSGSTDHETLRRALAHSYVRDGIMVANSGLVRASSRRLFKVGSFLAALSLDLLHYVGAIN